MGKRFLLAIILAGCTLVGFAQDIDYGKLSVTTQMFLEELKGELNFNRDTQSETKLGLVPSEDLLLEKVTTSRLYAEPQYINGKAYISAFIRLKDNNSVSDLEALGVQVQNKFINGLVTALIPVDKIAEVSLISNVKNINVSKLMRPTTHIARQKTNVDDVLTNSTDAIGAGLLKKYDGTGVILGIIDTGIDFQHIAFKDKNGNSRIKRAYVYDGSTEKAYGDAESIATITTDDKTGDHGTHTSSTAGGSSVIVENGTITVTDDHAAATYGGMAPGADLYLAGINSLSTAPLTNALVDMVQYAEEQGKPLVVSNSWGSQIGPHDGTGEVAEAYNSFFGPSHPNRVALFASSNDGGKALEGEHGGYHVRGTATEANPLSTVLRAHTYSNTDGGYYYLGIMANVWARNTAVDKLGVKILVLNSTTGEVLDSKTVTSGGLLSGLVSFPFYYSNNIRVYYDQIDSDKTQIILYSSSGCESRGASQDGYMSDGETPFYKSNYTLAMQVYPIEGATETEIDAWGGNYGYFIDTPASSGYTWTAGSDDMCVSDETTIENVISVGAYVSSKTWTDYKGNEHSDEHYTNGDIAYFSSYATATETKGLVDPIKYPDGQAYPWITAPGARLAAGVNHLHTASVDSYSYYGDTFNSDLVVNDANYPYAEMEGTSMATPTAAGIVALWMQAAQEVNLNPTVGTIKEIMASTAIKDYYVTGGPNASHFGANGKIDALAGIVAILGATPNPTIIASPNEVVFAGYATRTYTETINVKGYNLEGNITAALTGDNVFSFDVVSIAKANAEADGGVNITVTWTPAPGDVGSTKNATLTLSSDNANTITINIRGTAQAPTPTIIADKESLAFFAEPSDTPSQTITVTGRFLTQDVIATLGGTNASVFSVSPASLAYADVNDDTSPNGAALTVTFSPTTAGDYTATLTLSSTDAEDVVINLSGEAAEGGSAHSPYLNIKKYTSIGTGSDGWNTSKVDLIYKYTEYPTENVAWLSMPVYGAFISVHESPKAQDWIETDVSTDWDGTRTNRTWNAITGEPYLGSAPYFTSKTARVMGNGTTNETVTFYVTNTTAIKLLGYNDNAKGINLEYPTSLTVYECTMTNGTLTPAETAIASPSSIEENAQVNLSVYNLDKTKIYKVVAGEKRGYLYEIAFRTPINTTPVICASPTSLTFPNTEQAKTSTMTFKVTGTNLTNDVTATVTSGSDVFSISTASVSKADAEAEGQNITVTFAPTAVSTDYSGAITLSSTGASDVVVNLNGHSPSVRNYYDLTISSAGVSTMYLDFPVEIPWDADGFEGLTGICYPYEITANNTIRSANIRNSIPAYTGVVVYGNSGTYRFPRAIDAETLKFTPILSGTTSNTTVEQALAAANSNGIILTLGRSQDRYVGFYRYSGTNLPAYKAFFIYEGGSNVKELSLVIDGDETDGINSIDANTEQDGWYTPLGIKLNGKPTQKGLYIHQGRTVLIK